MSVPSWVVALRHSATHVTMPSLTLLKSAAEFALKWLKENYWEKQVALISIGELYSKNLYSKYFTLKFCNYIVNLVNSTSYSVII